MVYLLMRENLYWALALPKKKLLPLGEDCTLKGGEDRCLDVRELDQENLFSIYVTLQEKTSIIGAVGGRELRGK